jgi:hypothetical protein
MRPSAFFALLCALLLTHCGENSSSACGDTDIPRLECGSDAACILAVGACLPKCESDEACAADELCDSQLVYTFNTELLTADVCFPTTLLELPQTDAELDEREQQCRARDLQDCERDPRCQWERASKLDLAAKCAEPMPVGCIALGTLCTLSVFVAENAQGELFDFAMGCGNEAYTAVNFSFDDPRYVLLFGGETTVDDWPMCN